MRIPPHGRNLNGSEPRVTEEKTNVAFPERRSKQILKLRSNRVENCSSRLSLSLETQRKHLSPHLPPPSSSSSFAGPVLEFRCERCSARRGGGGGGFGVGPGPGSARLRRVCGWVSLHTEAPARCRNQGGACTDADPPTLPFFLCVCKSALLQHFE